MPDRNFPNSISSSLQYAAILANTIEYNQEARPFLSGSSL
jgi:hypothetical protein